MTLRLGKDTGSLVNYTLSGHIGGPRPEVGMGCTILMWTDRRPATIIRVSPSGKTVTVREDAATRTDTNGMSESQAYTFAPDPNGEVLVFRLGKRGWRGRGGSPGLRIGERGKYHDYSF